MSKLKKLKIDSSNIVKRIYSNGTYEGEWKDGKRHGKGTMTYACGDIYYGEFIYDKRHGKGTITYACGNIYVGQWENNKRNGKGTCTYANGDVYVGEWKDDKKHGNGTYRSANGDVFVGEWKHDNIHGNGTHIYPNGKRYFNKYKNFKLTSSRRPGTINPTKKRSRSRKIKNIKPRPINDVCCICHETMNTQVDDLVFCIKCRNSFHFGCIDKLKTLSSSCPCCREKLEIHYYKINTSK